MRQVVRCSYLVQVCVLQFCLLVAWMLRQQLACGRFNGKWPVRYKSNMGNTYGHKCHNWDFIPLLGTVCSLMKSVHVSPSWYNDFITYHISLVYELHLLFLAQTGGCGRYTATENSYWSKRLNQQDATFTTVLKDTADVQRDDIQNLIIIIIIFFWWGVCLCKNCLCKSH